MLWLAVLIMKSSRTETRIKSGFSSGDIGPEYVKMINHETVSSFPMTSKHLESEQGSKEIRKYVFCF